MNQQSLEKTLKRPAQLNAVVVPGYQRVFNAPFDGYAFLNLAEDEASCIDVAYFTLEQNELSLFDIREAGSDIIEVMPGYFAFVWPIEKCQDLPVLESYVRLCEKAASDLLLDFQKGLVLPEKIVIDLEDPQYTA